MQSPRDVSLRTAVWRHRSARRILYPPAVRIDVDERAVTFHLARWQKILGLLGDIVVERDAIAGARVVERPVGEVMRTGLKIGLRLPPLCYVGRTINLKQAFVVTRRVPALELTLVPGQHLQRVLVSTPRAQELAGELGGG